MLATQAAIRYNPPGMASTTPLPNKKDVARALLLKGTLFVHLDPRVQDVAVPAWLKRQPQLVLQVGLDMPVPIPDFRVDDIGVFGTLSFNRTGFTCSVPWDAVFALAGDDGRGMVWPESMPKEIAAEVEREARRARIAAREDGTREDGVADDVLAQPKRRRRISQPAVEVEHQVLLSKKPASVGLRGLPAITGRGIRAVAPLRSERRSPPPYLRLVK